MADTIELTLDELDRRIQAAVEKATARVAETRPEDKVTDIQPPTPALKAPSGMELELFLRAIVAGRGNPHEASALAKRLGYPETVQKALTWGVDTEGGYLVPPEYATTIIELLRQQAVFMKANPVTVDMPRGKLVIPAITGGSNAEYIGETAPAPITSMTFGQVNLTAKKLAAVVPVSNDLIRYSPTMVQPLVTSDLIGGMAVRFDQAAIRDNGTGDVPKGLRYWAPAGNVIAANPTVNAVNVEADLWKLIGKLEDSHVRFLRPVWLFAPRTKRFLMQLKNSQGNYVFKDEMLSGKLLGFPWLQTATIPINLGSGADESEVYFADFADVIVGTAASLQIDVSAEATYVSGGTVYSAFQRDMTLMRAIWEHDIAMRHVESVAVLTGVKWI
ncbi:MAG: phage major capsid protein [Candidatus Caldarchaeum sp.]